MDYGALVPRPIHEETKSSPRSRSRPPSSSSKWRSSTRRYKSSAVGLREALPPEGTFKDGFEAMVEGAKRRHRKAPMRR